MTPEQLIGRVQALEWLVILAVADGIARAPAPHDAAAGFQALCLQEARSLTDLARVQGEAGGGAQTAAFFASALIDLGQVIIHASAAATATSDASPN